VGLAAALGAVLGLRQGVVRYRAAALIGLAGVCMAPVGVAAVAVGTEIALRPPHRSVRAELPHTAPALSHDAKR
jgi:hypothetical protein